MPTDDEQTRQADSPPGVDGNRSQSAVAAHHVSGSMQELFRIAFPLMLSSGSLSLMSVGDRIMLAGYSADALAASTPGSMLHWTAVCIPLGTILYANTFVSQYDGAGRIDRMMSSVWQAVWLAIIGGVLLMLCVPFSHALLRHTGQPASVVRLEADYFNVLCLGSPVLLLSNALSCFFSGRRRTAVVLAVNLLGVFVNFGLDYLLVYGIHPFPELGIRGAALATVLTRCVDVLLYLGLIFVCRERRQLAFWRHWRFDWALSRRFLRYGVPSGMHFFVDNSGFTTFLMIVGTVGRNALAATNLAFSINGLIYVPLLGFGTAIQTVVGYHIGSRDREAAARTAGHAALLGLLWTGAAALVLVLLPRMALSPFFLFADRTAHARAELAEIVPTVVILFRFVAIYSMCDALAVVYSSVLRGAGDTIFPMLITLGSSWTIMVLPAWLLSRQPDCSITWLWVTCATHISFTGMCMYLRFRNGRWKLIELTEH